MGFLNNLRRMKMHHELGKGNWQDYEENITHVGLNPYNVISTLHFHPKINNSSSHPLTITTPLI